MPQHWHPTPWSNTSDQSLQDPCLYPHSLCLYIPASSFRWKGRDYSWWSALSIHELSSQVLLCPYWFNILDFHRNNSFWWQTIGILTIFVLIPTQSAFTFRCYSQVSTSPFILKSPSPTLTPAELFWKYLMRQKIYNFLSSSASSQSVELKPVNLFPVALHGMHRLNT